MPVLNRPPLVLSSYRRRRSLTIHRSPTHAQYRNIAIFWKIPILITFLFQNCTKRISYFVKLKQKILTTTSTCFWN